MSTRLDADFETLQSTDRVSDSRPGQDSNPLHDQYVADLFQPRDNYNYHGGSDRTTPPPPERASDRNHFEVIKNARGEIDRINFADGVSLRRAGPKEWQLYKNEQPASAPEIQAFARENALGFPMQPRDGKIIGNIIQKDNGDIQYDARNTELNIYATRKADGSRDIRNYNDYSRLKIGSDGQVQDKDYWDGYQWRHGREQQLGGGRVQIVFDTNERQPAGSNKPWPRAIVRDAGSDSLTVNHNDHLTMHATWREQKLITRQAGQQDDIRYYDGENWRHGREQNMPGSAGPAQLRRIDFTDGTGPAAIIIDVTTGEIREKIGRQEQPEPGPRPRTARPQVQPYYRPQPQYWQPQPRPYYSIPRGG